MQTTAQEIKQNDGMKLIMAILISTILNRFKAKYDDNDVNKTIR
jgi:hypothetical protein